MVNTHRDASPVVKLDSNKQVDKSLSLEVQLISYTISITTTLLGVMVWLTVTCITGWAMVRAQAA